MRSLACLFLFFSIFSLSAQNQYSIQADVHQLRNGDTVFLVFQADDLQVNDSTTVINGCFSFSGKLEFPVMAALYLHKNPYKTKLAKGESIDYFRFYLAPENIKMQSADSLNNIRISGSPTNSVHGILKNMLKENDDAFTRLNQEYAALPEEKKKDKTVLKGFIEREKELMNESYRIHLRFAQQHPDSYLSVISLAHIAARPGMGEEAGKAWQQLPARLKNSPTGKGIPVLVASQTRTQVGKPAIDFSLPGPDGKLIAVADFKGRYLLLDFWASWCGPCRAENPNLVKAYTQYREKGFEILGISLDAKAQKEAWIKAIEQDKLGWSQVSDLKGWDCEAAKLYGVRGIPANFLIDPEGNIVAKDLRGEELLSKLNSIFTEK